MGVTPPAHSWVPGASGSPASQRLRLTFMGDCGYWDPLPSASAALSVLTTLPSIDHTSASVDQSKAYLWDVPCVSATGTVVERL